MAIAQTELENIIQQAFPEAAYTITDLAGDDNHYALEIEDASFSGKTRIEQHKQVYAALDGRMGGALHALKLKMKART